MGVRPSGTVTFLFTDIEGSTARWEADEELMRDELARHDEVVRRAVDSHGGWLFKHTGDGACAAFASASAAVGAAIEAQRLLALPVRMGLASGEAELRGEDYFGSVVNRAARVMDAGHGGQILLASSTAAVLSGVELDDLGDRRLRDLSAPLRLYQVRADGLRVVFPPLRTLEMVPGNLPVQVTSFVGRGRELVEVVAAVQAHRIVTLTGVGGVGKSRLALQVAGVVGDVFADGVWLVELAPIGEGGVVADAVADVVGVTPRTRTPTGRSVAESLAGRYLLLVLDNCEHVLDAAAEVVDAILATTPSVSVLTTSREPLGVVGEQVWPVLPLDTSERGRSAAAGLFVERARAASPSFDPGADDDAVADICRHLDGIPLAIELAAARMRSMTPSEVRDRLDERFRFLTGPRRGPERHRTLRDAVQWSFDLLTDEERTLLCRCSGFAGGFDVAAAQRVCSSDRIDDLHLLDGLDSLVRKSLVTAEATGGRTRYGMLETIREFAVEQLAASGEADQIRHLHACYFADKADAILEMWASPRQQSAYRWIETEFSNLRTGFRWAASHHDVDSAERIAITTGIVGVWIQRYEPSAWAEELLDSARRDGSRRLPSLYATAAHCCLTGRISDAVAYGEAVLDLNDEPDYDPVPFAYGYVVLGAAYWYAGQMDKPLETAAACRQRPDDRLTTGPCQLAYGLAITRRFDEAQTMAEEAVAATTAGGIPSQVAFALVAYGRAYAEADPDRALAAMRRGLAVAHDSANTWYEGFIGQELAALEALHGDPSAALESFHRVIKSQYHAGDVVMLTTTLSYLALFFDRLGRPEPAATLYGTVADPPSHAAPSVNLSVTIRHLNEVMGSAGFEQYVRVGAAMDRREATLYAQTEIERARNEQSTGA